MRDQGPFGPGAPPPSGDGEWERPPAPVTRGRFGEPRTERNGGSYARNGHPVPMPPDDVDDDLDDGPLDLVELQADDELINALSSGLAVSGPGYRGYDVDDRLAALLSSWKEDVERAPVPVLVDTDEAVEMLQPAKPSRRFSLVRPLVAAAAVAACALAVVSISAHEAQPGDALWGVSKVLYSDRADQVQAAADLRSGIERVNAKLASGDTAGAQQELAALAPLVDRTAPDQRSGFEQQNRFLTAKVAETPPGTPTDPRAPLRDGTPAPPPPVVTSEGAPDVTTPPPAGTPAAPQPQTPPRSEPKPSQPGSGTSTPGDPRSGSTGSSGTTRPEGTSPESAKQDPRQLRAPAPSDPSSGTTTEPKPENPPETSPTTEGNPDPTTTSTTPTASGEGGPDNSGTTSPPSSTETGAVSSTPN